MREHMGLYRGKRMDNGEWVEGAFCPKNSKSLFGRGKDIPNIIKLDDPYSGFWFEVDPDTVGECTGLTDKNGKLIFEGDRVVYPDCTSSSCYDDYNEGVVDYDEEAMRFYFTDRWFVEMEDFDVVDGMMIDVEIIGNIHDNPELLKGGEADE